MSEMLRGVKPTFFLQTVAASAPKAARRSPPAGARGCARGRARGLFRVAATLVRCVSESLEAAGIRTLWFGAFVCF